MKPTIKSATPQKTLLDKEKVKLQAKMKPIKKSKNLRMTLTRLNSREYVSKMKENTEEQTPTGLATMDECLSPETCITPEIASPSGVVTDTEMMDLNNEEIAVPSALNLSPQEKFSPAIPYDMQCPIDELDDSPCCSLTRQALRSMNEHVRVLQQMLREEVAQKVHFQKKYLELQKAYVDIPERFSPEQHKDTEEKQCLQVSEATSKQPIANQQALEKEIEQRKLLQIQYEAEFSRCQKKLETEREWNQRLQKKVDSLKATGKQSFDLQQALEEVKEQRRLLQSQYDDLQAKFQRSEERAKIQHSPDKVDGIQATSKQVIALQQALEEETEQRRLLKDNYDKLEAEFNSIVEKLKTERETNQQLQYTVHDLKSVGEHVLALEQSLEDLTEQRRLYKSHYDRMHIEFFNSQGKLKTEREWNQRLQEKVDSLQGSSDQIINFQHALEKETEQRRLLQSRYNELQAAYLSSQEKQELEREKIQHPQDDVDRTEDSSLQKALQEEKAQRRLLQSEYDQLQAEFIHTQEKLKIHLGWMQHLQDKVDKLGIASGYTIHLQQSLELESKQRKLAENHCTATVTRLEKSEMMHLLERKRNWRYQDKLKSVNGEIIALQKKRKVEMEERKLLENQYSHLQAAYQDSQERQKLEREKVLRLQGKVDRLTVTSEQATTLKQALKEETEQRRRLRREFNELKATYADSREEAQQERKKNILLQKELDKAKGSCSSFSPPSNPDFSTCEQAPQHEDIQKLHKDLQAAPVFSPENIKVLHEELEGLNAPQQHVVRRKRSSAELQDDREDYEPPRKKVHHQSPELAFPGDSHFDKETSCKQDDSVSTIELQAQTKVKEERRPVKTAKKRRLSSAKRERQGSNN